MWTEEIDGQVYLTRYAEQVLLYQGVLALPVDVTSGLVFGEIFMRDKLLRRAS